jgi:hypothetical protein
MLSFLFDKDFAHTLLFSCSYLYFNQEFENIRIALNNESGAFSDLKLFCRIDIFLFQTQSGLSISRPTSKPIPFIIGNEVRLKEYILYNLFFIDRFVNRFGCANTSVFRNSFFNGINIDKNKPIETFY